MDFLTTQIDEHMMILKTLRFQEQTYTMRPDEYEKLRHQILKKQTRLNQLVNKRDHIENLVFFEKI